MNPSPQPTDICANCGHPKHKGICKVIIHHEEWGQEEETEVCGCQSFTPQPQKEPSTEHATVTIGEYNVPIIGIKKDQTQEVCHLCKQPKHMQDVEMCEEGFICNDCKPSTEPRKEGDEKCVTQSTATVTDAQPERLTSNAPEVTKGAEQLKRGCPDCLRPNVVLPDGYCGHCRQCTLPPIEPKTPFTLDHLSQQMLKEVTTSLKWFERVFTETKEENERFKEHVNSLEKENDELKQYRVDATAAIEARNQFLEEAKSQLAERDAQLAVCLDWMKTIPKAWVSKDATEIYLASYLWSEWIEKRNQITDNLSTTAQSLLSKVAERDRFEKALNSLAEYNHSLSDEDRIKNSYEYIAYIIEEALSQPQPPQTPKAKE